jgi:DNA-binding ferritin-like protein (Dps family)
VIATKPGTRSKIYSTKTPDMNIQYIKRINSKVPCRTCKGTGKYEVKEYHNQYREVKCYLCDNGEIDSIEETDITQEINSLLQKTSQ